MSKIVLYGMLIVASLLFFWCVHCDPVKSKAEPPLNQLANVVRFFPTTELSNRKCNASTGFDDTGSLYILFKTKVKSGENPDDICDVMYHYMNQNNWLVDTDHKCTVEQETVTMALNGPSNPGHNPNSPVMPVAVLAAVLKKFPNATVGDHTCTPTSHIQLDGLTHILLQCQLTNDSPSPTQVCENIIAYFNQNNWLDNATNNCSRQGLTLALEIIGK